MRLGRFISALRLAGLSPDAESVADFFFLAAQVPLPELRLDPASEVIEERSQTLPVGSASSEMSHKKERPSPPAPEPSDKTGLFVQGADATGKVAAAEIEVPEAPSLPQTLEIARSLRPLLKPYQAMTAGPLDEEATAEQSAHMRQLILVFGPRNERWFDVALLVEDAPSMAIWSRTIRSFERMLVALGAFRDIRIWRLNADASIADAAGRPVPSTALLAPDGRRILLIITQGVTAVWQSHAFAEAILQWGHRQPTAVVQLLPERLWENTGLGETQILARSRLPGSPNSQWDLELPAWMKRRMAGGVALPILALAPGSLGGWAQMLMARVNAAAPSVLWSAPSSAAAATAKPEVLEIAAEDRIDRFRRIASADGLRLAAELSAGPITLPILRLVNQTLFGEFAKQDTIAQVLLGGILRKKEDHVDPELVYFDFHAGVRERLAGMSHSLDRFAVRRQITLYLQQHPDTTERFRVLVPHKDGKHRIPEWAMPFADESEALLRACGLLIEEEAANHATDLGQVEIAGGNSVPLGRRAILLGIDEYADSALAPLHHCAEEAISLGAALRERGFETLVFTNQEATRVNVMDAIVEVSERSRGGDIFWFHYSGHLASQGNRKLRVAPYDALVSSVSRLLELREIVEPAQRMGALAFVTSDSMDQYASLPPDCAYIVGGLAYGQSAEKIAPEDLASTMLSVIQRADASTPITMGEFIRGVTGDVKPYSNDSRTSPPACFVPEAMEKIVLLEAVEASRSESISKSSAGTNDLESSVELSSLSADSVDPSTMPPPKRLIGLSAEMKALDEAWKDPQIYLVQIVGAPGIGKTSLMATWAHKHLNSVPHFWWSFDVDTSPERFFDSLLFYMAGLTDPSIADGGPTMIEKAKRIAESLRTQELLLLIDGIDRLQDDDGTIQDTVFRDFIRESVERNIGQAICTCRSRIAGITERHTSTIEPHDFTTGVYETLPHARPGGVSGLLELLVDQQGTGNIYRLAEDLAFELDDLMPIVESAQLLGLLRVEGGDAVVTSAGFEFARYPGSPSQPLRELFRQAALAHVLLLRQISDALVTKTFEDVAPSVPKELFLESLREQFHEEEAVRQLETAIAWGRYAGLFDYDLESHSFILPRNIDPAETSGPISNPEEEIEALDQAHTDEAVPTEINAWQEEKRRIEQELSAAREIQRKLLDIEIPILDWVQIAFSSLTCYEIGGDFCDVIASESSVSLLIADVSGKGMKAALLSQTLHDMARNQLSTGMPLDSVAIALNSGIIAEDAPENYPTRYVTMVILRLHRSGALDYINCGHIAPLILSGGTVRRLEISNVPVGLIPSPPFEAGTEVLQHGDRLLMVTDGVAEAENPQQEMFGDDRLRQAFQASSNLQELFTAVSNFRGAKPLTDDCTMIEVVFTDSEIPRSV